MTLQAFVDRHADPVWVVDADYTRVIHVNPAACVALGSTAEKLLQRCPSELGLAPGVTRMVTRRPGDERVEIEVTPLPIDWGGKAAVMLTSCDETPRSDRGLTVAAAPATQTHDEEHQLRHALAEALPVIVATFDVDGQIAYLSRRFHDLTGLPPERRGIDDILEMVHPEDRLQAETRSSAAFAAQRSAEVELRLRDASTGGYRWHQISVRPQCNTEGEVEKWYGVGVDIEARKQAEAALRTSEARYRSLLELLPVAVWEEDWSGVRALADQLTKAGITDLRAHFSQHPELLEELQSSPTVVAANPTAYSIFAARNEDDVARVHAQWFETAEARESHLEEILAFIDGKPPPARELPVKTAEGRPIRVIQRLGFDAHAEAPNRVVHCLTDITQRVHAEERMRVVSELVSDVIWDHDISSGDTWCSEGFRTRYGHDPVKLAELRDDWAELVHPEDRAWVLDGVAKADAEGRNWLEQEYRFRRADGSYAVIQDRIRLLRDGEGRVRRMIGVIVDVTAARAEEERQKALVEIGSDAAFEYDPVRQTIHFGEGFRTVFGLDLVGEKRVPTKLIDHMHPDDRDWAFKGFFQLLFSDQRSRVLEYRLLRGDGRWADVLERVIVLRNDDGTPRRVYAVLVDVSAQRQSEERLRLAAQASREVVFDWDIQSDRMEWSGAAFERYGYDPGAFPGTSARFIDRVHPEDRHILIEAARTLRRGEDFPELHEAHYRFFRADGSLAHVISRSQALRDASGRAVRLVGMMFDVSELHREEERMRAIVEVSADAVWEYHPETNMMVFSEGMKRHFGHEWVGERSVPSPWRKAVHPDDLPRIMRGFSDFLDGRASRWRTAYRMKRGDGTWAHVEERVVALRDEHGKALRVIGSFDDVTERTRLQEQLHNAQKMESIGRIAGGIAHDFNNLLAVVMGNAELTLETSDAAEIAEFGNEIVQACQRGAELTRRLLSFARRSQLAPKVINLNETVTAMSRLISRAIPESIDLQTALTAGLWNTRADPAFVESSLLNLVLNARDAMPEGGKLTIETGNMRVSDSYVTERGEELAPGRYVMLAVSDTGTGIARDIIDKVIEPFFTTKGPHLGTGLGLAMVHGFVRQSGGALRIYSEPGVGTTVRILLPAEEDATDRPMLAASADLPAPARRGARILLAEDEDAVRRTIARILSDRGYVVVDAPSGDAALAAFEAATEPFDMLLSDVVMPGKLQGPMLANELKRRAPGLGIVFMSGYASEAAVNGNGLRMDDLYLMKPIQRRELLQVIEALLERLKGNRAD